MGGHRIRKVRTLAPGPEGTEKLRMTRRNVIERFGGCVSAQAECVYRKKNMRVTAKQSSVISNGIIEN